MLQNKIQSVFFFAIPFDILLTSIRSNGRKEILQSLGDIQYNSESGIKIMALMQGVKLMIYYQNLL